MPQSGPGVRLEFLGAIKVERNGTPVTGRAVQRRRLAILVLLAAAPGQAVSRDRIIGLLWPDSTSRAARRLLADAVYDLRQALGDAAVVSRGDDLMLAPAVRSDVADFTEALASGDLPAVCRLHGGQLVPGFYVTDAPDFDHWLEAHRTTLRREWRTAMAACARRQEGAADVAGAAELLLRLAQDDLLHEHAVLEAMHALARAGQRARAVQLAGQHGAAMEAAALPVSNSVPALSLTLRQAPTVALPQSPPADVALPPEASPPAPMHPLPPSVPPRMRAGLAMLALAILLVAIAAWTHLGSDPRSGPATDNLTMGERAWREGRVLEALGHFEHAASAAPSNAKVWYRLSQASIAADLPQVSIRSADSVLGTLAPASDPGERLLLIAWDAFRTGKPELAEQYYRSLLTHYPASVEAWIQLGETLFHYNPPRGRPIQEAAAAFGKALSLDPGNWHAQWHLALMASARGDRKEHLRFLRDLAGRNGVETAQAIQLAILIRTATPRFDSAAVATLASRLDEYWLYRTIWVTSTYQRNLVATAQLAHHLADPSRPRQPRMLGLGVLLNLAMGRGDWPEAERLLAALEGTRNEPRWLLGAWVPAALMPDSGRPARILEKAWRMTSAWHPSGGSDEALRDEMLGLLAHARGDDEAAAAHARSLAARGGDPAVIHAAIALDRGDPERAIELLARPVTPGWFGNAFDPAHSRSYERFLRGRALAAAGRPAEAAAWLQSLTEYVPSDLAYASLVARTLTTLSPRELAVRSGAAE